MKGIQDIVRAFTDDTLAHGVSINIQGSIDDPLFQANQIGPLLGLSNIRESIRDFDETERVVIMADSLGGLQNTVYRLLGMSTADTISYGSGDVNHQLLFLTSCCMAFFARQYAIGWGLTWDIPLKKKQN